MTMCLVAYDVVNAKTRRALYRLLRGYGEPVQRSVFRSSLDKAVMQRLERELAGFPLGPADRLLFETLHAQRPIAHCLLALQS